MNREEFLRQLEQLLTGISEEEKADAMAFYRSYFEDAGEGNEASIIKELGSPKKVADNIRKNLGLDGSGSYYNTYADRDSEYYKNVSQTITNLGGGNEKKDHTGTTVAWVVAAVILSPIWLSLLLALAGVLLAVVAVVFSVALAAVLIMAVLVISGFLLIGVGFQCLFTGTPVIGIGLIGGGLIILALGLLAVVAVVWSFGWFLPWVFQGICALCRKPFHKRKERASV